ncbi:lysine--tRNA ligase [Candidatus Saccharibacteria bacterium]|nr:lysine--tRNA ligase [Candidatus Saccharibacteria bacterium]
MQWLNKVVDEVIAAKPKGQILIESGGSPSGTYHFGHLRELVICDAILLELRRRGRQARHVYYVDDLDALRKIPPNVPAEFEKYLGMPLCDVPAPDGSDQSYGDYFLEGLIKAANTLGIEVEFIHSHQKYRQGFFVQAIETALSKSADVKKILETISGHKLGEEWSPIQVNEDGYLKKRRFLGIDKRTKTITYEDKDKKEQTISYAKGDVKLDWRIDWPARWWLLKVNVEPFGRDHSSAGGSYDTGAALARKVFGAEPPFPVPYDFVNLAGDTKKMSASKGTGLDAETVIKVLPPEIIRFMMLQSPPSKRLYFDPIKGVSKQIDKFARLLENNPQHPVMLYSRAGIKNLVVSNIPFSLLCESYQAALKDPSKTIEVIKRTNYGHDLDEKIVKNELKYINQWLKQWAPEDIKFELREQINSSEFSDTERNFLKSLGQKITSGPADADGEWFHKAIYDLQDQTGMEPKAMFETLYKALIGKTRGPRAGWFLSILPRDWLIKRLKLEA